MTTPEQAVTATTQEITTTIMHNAAVVQAVNTNAFLINVFGYQFNLMTILIMGIIFGILFMFYKIQTSERLDFADMFTKDGRKVSSTKVLQFIGGISSTWFIVKTGLQGTLTPEIFGIYLAYVASIEGFSKFISAKYNYTETSLRDATSTPLPDGPLEQTNTKAVTEDGEIKTIEQTVVKKG